MGPGHSSARLQELHETPKNRTSVRGGGPVFDARGTKSVPSNSPATAAHGKPNQPEKSSPFFPESTYYNGRKNRVMYTHLRFCLLGLLLVVNRSPKMLNEKVQKETICKF